MIKRKKGVLIILFICGLFFTFPKSTFAKESVDRTILLRPDESTYQLTGDVFQRATTNAFPGMSLPLQKIRVINFHNKKVQISAKIEWLESELPWFEGRITYNQRQPVEILIDKEHALEQTIITLEPEESIDLDIAYSLIGEKMLNSHQNQSIQLKWAFICTVQPETSKTQLPSTGERKNQLNWIFVLMLLISSIYRGNWKKQ